MYLEYTRAAFSVKSPAHPKLRPVETNTAGIFLAGCSAGPKDIPDTVAQASGVAADVLRSIVSGKGQESRRQLSLDDIEKSARALAAQ